MWEKHFGSLFAETGLCNGSTICRNFLPNQNRNFRGDGGTDPPPFWRGHCDHFCLTVKTVVSLHTHTPSLSHTHTHWIVQFSLLGELFIARRTRGVTIVNPLRDSQLQAAEREILGLTRTSLVRGSKTWTKSTAKQTQTNVGNMGLNFKRL